MMLSIGSVYSFMGGDMVQTPLRHQHASQAHKAEQPDGRKPKKEAHLPGLGDVLLRARRVPGVGRHVAHLRLGLDGDDADGDAVEARAAGDDGARPAGLGLDPRAAVEEAGLPAGLAAAVAAWVGLDWVGVGLR